MYTDMLKAIIKGINLNLYYIFVAAYIVVTLALLLSDCHKTSFSDICLSFDGAMIIIMYDLFLLLSVL